MSQQALRTQGMSLEIENTPGDGAFTVVGEITSINGPTGQAPVIDVTDLASTAREKILGLPDLAQMSLSVWFRPENPQHDQLWKAFNDYSITKFRLTFTDATPTVWEFDAYVSGFTVNADIDNAVTGDITLEISGSITENPGP